jgi:hypothetical protein
MLSKQIALTFAQEVVLLIVFLSGIWIRSGLYPEEQLWSSILLEIYSLVESPYFFWLMPFFILFGSVLSSYFIGGWLSLLAIGLAFLGGYFISNPFFSIVLFLIGMILGIFAPLRE